VLVRVLQFHYTRTESVWGPTWGHRRYPSTQ